MANNLKKDDNKVVFEVSWEACNKVGGIYTVINSKSSQAKSVFGNNYYLIGPYFHNKAIGEFEEAVPEEFMKKIADELKQLGIICHFGSWLNKAEPNVILLEFQSFYSKTNEIKGNLWNWFRIDSLNTGLEVNEPVTWSYVVGILLEKLYPLLQGKKIVAQFHEWMSGAGLLYLKQNKIPISTVFTTHATMLGRTIASSQDLYQILDKIEPDKEAYNYGVYTKHQIEKQCALNADVFTTVSEITAIEAEKLLGKKPDLILPNGLDLDEFPSFEDASVKHIEFKFRIKEFVLYNFFPYHNFNIDETLIYFIFARYEFHNKGIDVFIQALSKLNEKLKQENGRTVVAFFFIPTAVRTIKPQLIENKLYYDDIIESIEQDATLIKNKIKLAILAQKELSKENLFTQDFLTEIKRKVMKFAKKGIPLSCTHDLQYEQGDPILNSFKHFSLNNKEEDKVKVVFYPIYLTGADGLINLDYYQTILGCHLGVFPSVYEPWGYTPLEAAAFGVASVTTDLAGFGRYINSQRPKEICYAEKCDPAKESGIFVMRNFKRPYEEIVEELSEILHYYAQLDKQDRIENKIEARRLATLADWHNLYKHYMEAYDLAVERGFK